MIEPLLDSNLIVEKSTNLVSVINKPSKKCVSLDLNSKYDGETNGYFTVIQYNNKVLLYYRACSLSRNIFDQLKHNLGKIHHFQKNYEVTCFADSHDGIIFNSSKLLFKNYTSHNFFPFLNKDKSCLFGIGGTQQNTNGLLFFESNNFLNWEYKKNILTGKDLLPGWSHPNHFDTQNIAFYDINTKQYKLYTRDNKPHQRHIQYSSTKDFIIFDKFNNININYNDHLYNPCIYPYNNSKYYIGFISTHNPDNYHKYSMLVFSVDGHNWDILDSNHIPDIEKSYMVAHGMIDSQEHKKLLIYSHVFLDKKLLCYSYDYHRIREFKCDHNGYIILKNSHQQYNHIMINSKSDNDGYILIELIDNNNNIILTSQKITGNNYFKEVKWSNDTSIINLNICKIKVLFYKSSLYSFDFQ